MLIILHVLLLLRAGRCTDDLIFETKVVGVGDDVNLTCARQESDDADLYWIRLVSGDFPELLGGTFTFDHDGVNSGRHITTKQEPGTFLLHISKTERNDTGFYYCIKVEVLDMKFLTGTFLRIKGPEPEISPVIQVSPSDPVHPGDSVTLQCSVLSDLKTKTCAGDHSVFWFRAGSDESRPSLIYTHGNSSDQCEQSPEVHSPQKCVYSFSKSVSSSDAGTYYCAVATCGQILFGKESELDTKALWDLQTASTLLILLCAALVISLIVIAILIYLIKKKTCDCCKAAVSLQTDSATASGNQKSHLRDEDSLVYSAPTFTSRKAGKAERRNTRTAEGETVYTDVRALQ
ncbi:signal-regulatory protein beta-2-like [Toxotes jaculatrix]|uniref:signal-regulatory protein beta-2-like n=1 Tax=Toxotes jaculatrix TaxID=941984 RepID=UPI001B3B17D8|nr:signal-regulatory protein beta-2-like [Toxotes jaculatrix]